MCDGPTNTSRRDFFTGILKPFTGVVSSVKEINNQNQQIENEKRTYIIGKISEYPPANVPYFVSLINQGGYNLYSMSEGYMFQEISTKKNYALSLNLIGELCVDLNVAWEADDLFSTMTCNKIKF